MPFQFNDQKMLNNILITSLTYKLCSQLQTKDEQLKGLTNNHNILHKKTTKF